MEYQNVDQLKKQAIALYQRGDHVVAGNLFLELLEKEPRDLEALCALAAIGVLTNDPKGREYASMARSIDPDNQMVLVCEGIYLTRSANHSDALVLFDRVLVRNPKNIDALNNRICVHKT